jgi:hypothetical protein
MAKRSVKVTEKTTEKLDNVSDTRPGPGWKECKACLKWVKGPGTLVCPNCQTPFPVKMKAENLSDKMTEVQNAVTLIEKLGGLEEAKKKLETVRELLS